MVNELFWLVFVTDFDPPIIVALYQTKLNFVESKAFGLNIYHGVLLIFLPLLSILRGSATRMCLLNISEYRQREGRHYTLLDANKSLHLTGRDKL